MAKNDPIDFGASTEIQNPFSMFIQKLGNDLMYNGGISIAEINNLGDSAFKFMDADGNKKISEEEFNKFTNMLPEAGRAELIGKFSESFQKNGGITYQQFAAFKDQGIEKIKAFDKDGNGKVEWNEIEIPISALKAMIAPYTSTPDFTAVNMSSNLGFNGKNIADTLRITPKRIEEADIDGNGALSGTEMVPLANDISTSLILGPQAVKQTAAKAATKDAERLGNKIEAAFKDMDKGSGLFHKGRGDGQINRGELLEALEKLGVSRAERLEIKAQLDPNKSFDIHDVANQLKKSMTKGDADSISPLNPKEVALSMAHQMLEVNSGR